jgi:hypothetical protein
MLFNIDADEGSQILGWVMPDNPAATPSVIVVLPEGKELKVEATINRSDVVAILQVEFGFYHTTGTIGFVVDETHVPNLHEVQEIELLDGETRTLIYRRFQISRHIEKRLCYFELAVMPQRRVLQALSSHFALTYTYAERYPLETMMMLVKNFSARSILIMGRPNFIRQRDILRDAGYVISALLRDPYEELAERLVFINLLASSKASHLLPQLLSDVPALLDFARDLPINDPKAMLLKFRMATPEQRAAMASPMTRVFGCSIGESPEHRHISVALDNLATLDVVGTRARFADFRSMLKDFLEADVIGPADLEIFDKVKEARDVLSKIGIVSDLLENDLILYSHASEAIQMGLDGI